MKNIFIKKIDYTPPINNREMIMLIYYVTLKIKAEKNEEFLTWIKGKNGLSLTAAQPNCHHCTLTVGEDNLSYMMISAWKDQKDLDDYNKLRAAQDDVKKVREMFTEFSAESQQLILKVDGHKARED